MSQTMSAEEEVDLAQFGSELEDRAIQLAGLCEVVLMALQNSSVPSGDFKDGITLSWGYDSIARLATELSELLASQG